MSIAEMKRSIKEKVDTLADKDVEVLNYLISRINPKESAAQRSIDELYDDVKARYGEVLEKLAQ